MTRHLEVFVRRGDIPEARHRFHWVLADADGRVLDGSEQPGLPTTFRSSAKPFQLLPLVERGHADRWGFSDEQLAVMAASHTGSRHHLDLVRGILQRIGLEPRHLVCGYHDPDDPESREDVLTRSAPRSALYNNCSGKHAGLLALAVAEGWPVEGYHEAGHPEQQLLHRTVAEVCGLHPGAIRTAVDGCGLPVFSLPLSAMAHGYARLAAACAERGGSGRAVALRRIGGAMMAYPRVVEGAGRVSTALMEATGGRLLAKGGAEGLQLVALPERRAGLALKCEDGAQRAVGPAVVEVLERLGVLSAGEVAKLASIHHPVVLNAAGLEVGSLSAELSSAVRA